jgi:two-component system sensor histidine kinase/response regulator
VHAWRQVKPALAHTLLTCTLLASAALLIAVRLVQRERVLLELMHAEAPPAVIQEYGNATLLAVLGIASATVSACLAAWCLRRSNQHEATQRELRTALQSVSAAEAGRRRSLERLRMANEYAGISVWELDLVRDQLCATEGTDFSRRLGVNSCGGNEFIERFVHPEDRAAFYEVYRQALGKGAQQERFDHQYRLLHVDGSVRYMQFHASVARDAKHRPLTVTGVDWEVTFEVEAARELKQQAEQLRVAERRLERASRSSMEGHWETDMVTGWTWMSASLCALLGYDPGMQHIDWNLYIANMLHPDDAHAYKSSLAAHLKHGVPYQVRLRFLRGDGSGRYQWMALHGAVERDADGRLLRMAGSSRDVHEQQLAQLELMEVQARFDRAIRGTRDGLFDLDLKSGQLWVSPRMWEMIDHDPAQMPRQLSNHLDYVHPEDAAQLGDMLRAHVEQGTPYDIEYRMRRKSGDWLWVRSRAVAERDAQGVPVRFSGSVHDISEARAAREALIAATQEAKAANRAKSTFLATMSHEIRTPMNGLIGMTDLLLDTPLERTQRDYVETIRASSDSLLAIINDVLDFTKIEAGKLEVERIEMDLRATVEEVVAMMALPAAAKGVELIIDLQPHLPERVLGDPQRIRQCLSNLLGNAVKFTSHGEILIEIDRREVAGRNMTHFQVRDTGIGMTAEAAAALFQPFVQADSSTTRKFGGTGLGLSIVKRLVEIMGGNVGLESAVGVGSTFWFQLPLEVVAAASRHALRADDLVDARRVLIVEDNASQRRVLAAQLERAGYQCEVAASATEALSCLRSAVAQACTFDVVLIDRQLAGGDGEQLGAQINADPALAGARLVLLTAVDGGSDRKRFEQMGFAAYLTKPLRTAELLECLPRVLAHEAREWHLRTASMVARRVSAGARDSFRGRVLLVEDNLVNQKVAQKFVERLGCSVYIAQHGAEAVAVCERERFDLILMDMEMPVMDGTTATLRIRALEAALGRRTPIVALTANALSEQVERCLSAGMDDFLSKPIEAARLREVFAKFLSDAQSAPSQALALN